MKNKNLYDKTVAILVKAYLNDTLEHGNCTACAVGNIVAANCGYKVLLNKDHKTGDPTFAGIGVFDKGWVEAFITIRGNQKRKKRYSEEAKRQIESTGYNVNHLAKIEFAFETANAGNSKEEYMYNGLMAVIEVLGEIHSVSQEVTEETKLLFAK